MNLTGANSMGFVCFGEGFLCYALKKLEPRGRELKTTSERDEKWRGRGKCGGKIRGKNR